MQWIYGQGQASLSGLRSGRVCNKLLHRRILCKFCVIQACLTGSWLCFRQVSFPSQDVVTGSRKKRIPQRGLETPHLQKQTPHSPIETFTTISICFQLPNARLMIRWRLFVTECQTGECGFGWDHLVVQVGFLKLPTGCSLLTEQANPN